LRGEKFGEKRREERRETDGVRRKRSLAPVKI